ncbi:MAG: SPFH domain-containing protein [Flavobacteriia bacterium]|nr:SPFH domain-containing protein [Flavobacteriia bacterium]
MEKSIKAPSGWLGVLMQIALIVLSVVSFKIGGAAAFSTIPLGLLFFVALFGYAVINPNESLVLTFFGDYRGTIKANGFFWVNPLMVKKKVSLRARNLDSDPIKVNDKLGNPIMIGVVLVWKVKDTFSASFEVNDFVEFVYVQTDAAIRKLATSYPYDNFDDDESDICLRSDIEEVNDLLENEITERLAIAGIEVMEARISHLAYASEIAGAMLQRQQATAVVAARRRIVEGAVGMVELALDDLSKKEILTLDDEKKAAMVSNLMVVLCSERSASPVVNTGTLYQ